MTEREEELQDALEDMVDQFAYRTTKGRRLNQNTGGLSALEHAFHVLGWDDPHYIKGRPDFAGCDVKICYEWSRGTGRWDGMYLALCSDHLLAAHRNEPRPPLREQAIRRQRRRDMGGLLR